MIEDTIQSHDCKYESRLVHIVKDTIKISRQ